MMQSNPSKQSSLYPSSVHDHFVSINELQASQSYWLPLDLSYFIEKSVNIQCRNATAQDNVVSKNENSPRDGKGCYNSNGFQNDQY